MGKKEIKLETSLPLAQAVDYLADLVASLRQGRVVVQKGQEYIELNPSAQVEVEIEAVRKKDKEKFVLELTWRTGGEARVVDPPLRIGSQAMTPAAASAEESQEAPTGEEVAPKPASEPMAAAEAVADQEPNDCPTETVAASAGTEQIADCAAAVPAPAPAEPAEPGQGPKRRRRTAM
ncbi:MAG: amphi-Trp domain-containing protein [Thermodesulfobacteriota bacterium]